MLPPAVATAQPDFAEALNPSGWGRTDRWLFFSFLFYLPQPRRSRCAACVSERGRGFAVNVVDWVDSPSHRTSSAIRFWSCFPVQGIPACFPTKLASLSSWGFGYLVAIRCQPIGRNGLPLTHLRSIARLHYSRWPKATPRRTSIHCLYCGTPFPHLLYPVVFMYLIGKSSPGFPP
jgi:hypothetical protein